MALSLFSANVIFQYRSEVIFNTNTSRGRLRNFPGSSLEANPPAIPPSVAREMTRRIVPGHVRKRSARMP
jgi:hypothetical protein